MVRNGITPMKGAHLKAITANPQFYEKSHFRKPSIEYFYVLVKEIEEAEPKSHWRKRMFL